MSDAERFGPLAILDARAEARIEPEEVVEMIDAMIASTAHLPRSHPDKIAHGDIADRMGVKRTTLHLWKRGKPMAYAHQVLLRLLYNRIMGFDQYEAE